jgi:hypothetical protein
VAPEAATVGRTRGGAGAGGWWGDIGSWAFYDRRLGTRSVGSLCLAEGVPRTPCAGRLGQRVGTAWGGSQGGLSEVEPIKEWLVPTCTVGHGEELRRVRAQSDARLGRTTLTSGVGWRWREVAVANGGPGRRMGKG